MRTKALLVLVLAAFCARAAVASCPCNSYCSNGGKCAEGLATGCTYEHCIQWSDWSCGDSMCAVLTTDVSDYLVFQPCRTARFPMGVNSLMCAGDDGSTVMLQQAVRAAFLQVTAADDQSEVSVPH